MYAGLSQMDRPDEQTNASTTPRNSQTTDSIARAQTAQEKSNSTTHAHADRRGKKRKVVIKCNK